MHDSSHDSAGRGGAAAGVGATVWAALLVVYVVWGSTYLGIRVVVTQGLPPMVTMGLRFVVAGVLLAAVLAFRGGVRRLLVRWRELVSCTVVGLFLLLGGNGLVSVAEQDVPSALAALLVATTPLWLVGFRIVARDRPRWLTLAGTAAGFAGVAVLARPGATEGVPLGATLLVVAASFLWATGSFATGRMTMPKDPFVAAVWQMLVAGTAMAAVGAAAGELPKFMATLRDGVSPAGAGAWLYLVLAGSLLAYTAYYWLLRNAPISLVATYAYVNPVVAVLLGWALLSEPVTATVVLGGGLAVLGVLLVVSTERRPSRPEPKPASEVGPVIRVSSR